MGFVLHEKLKLWCSTPNIIVTSPPFPSKKQILEAWLIYLISNQYNNFISYSNLICNFNFLKMFTWQFHSLEPWDVGNDSLWKTFLDIAFAYCRSCFFSIPGLYTKQNRLEKLKVSQAICLLSNLHWVSIFLRTGVAYSFSSGFSFCCSEVIWTVFSSEPTTAWPVSTWAMNSTRDHMPVLLDSIMASRTVRVYSPKTKFVQHKNQSLHCYYLNQTIKNIK